MAVSGVKNSGKTTLIDRVLPLLNEAGIRTFVIKHDGHNFVPDVPGTDSFRHLQAGACATVCYCDKHFMAVRQDTVPKLSELIGLVPESDLVLLEGCKTSPYPKIEVVRSGNSSECVCKGRNLLAVATDLCLDSAVQLLGLTDGEAVLDMNRPEMVRDFILDFLQQPQKTPNIRLKTKLVLVNEEDFFGPGLSKLLHLIDALGSIRKAAAEMGMAYSKAWKQIGKAEKETGIQFLERANGGKNGGYSTLTEEGRRFVAHYDAMCQTLRQWSDTLWEQYMPENECTALKNTDHGESS